MKNKGKIMKPKMAYTEILHIKIYLYINQKASINVILNYNIYWEREELQLYCIFGVRFWVWINKITKKITLKELL